MAAVPFVNATEDTRDCTDIATRTGGGEVDDIVYCTDVNFAGLGFGFRTQGRPQFHRTAQPGRSREEERPAIMFVGVNPVTTDVGGIVLTWTMAPIGCVSQETNFLDSEIFEGFEFAIMVRDPV